MATRTVRARLDAQAQADFALLLRDGGTESEVLRRALADAATRRRRRSGLATEVAALAADPVDVAARRDAMADLDAIEAPWPD